MNLWFLHNYCDDINIFFAIHFRVVAQEELNAADQEKNIGIAVLSFISLVTLVFYFFVRNALSVIRVSEKCSMNRNVPTRPNTALIILLNRFLPKK